MSGTNTIIFETMKVKPALVVCRNDPVISREREANTGNLPGVSHQRIVYPAILSLLWESESGVLKSRLVVLNERRASRARQLYEKRKRRSTGHEK